MKISCWDQQELNDLIMDKPIVQLTIVLKNIQVQ